MASTELAAVEDRALAAARAVAEASGVPCERAEVLAAGSNVLVHLRPSPVVARVMTGTVALHEDPGRWLADEVDVLGFLAPSGTAVQPSSLIAPGPHLHDGLWMTFWQLLEHRGRADLGDGARRLGGALRDLHDQLRAFPGELPDLRDLRRGIERLLRLLRPAGELSAARIESLEARLVELDDAVFGTPLPAQALHGDASLYNLLRAESGRLVWNDFEDTCRGPVQWDLAGYLISVEHRGGDAAFLAAVLDAYGEVGASELAPFTAAHRLYDEIWQLYAAQAESGHKPPQSSR